jgi:hypothetical protein
MDCTAVWIKQRRDSKRKALEFDGKGKEGGVGVFGTVFCCNIGNGELQESERHNK